jgi:peptidoglycan/LPS O-acetylase OafA/YrhL
MTSLPIATAPGGSAAVPDRSEREHAPRLRVRYWRGHLPALDGLRGVAVLLVMLLHFTTSMPLPARSLAGGIRRALQFGWVGVDLFFVLSGFLITGILADNRSAPGFFATFYARRALRILPIYVAALLVVFHLVPLVLGPVDADSRTELAFWLFVANFRELSYGLAKLVGHFWSLAIEEQFYLVWPLIVVACTRRTSRRVAAATIVAAPILRFAALRLGVSGSAVYHFTPYRLDGLAMGAWIALTLRTSGGETVVRRLVTPAAVVGSAMFALLTGPLRLPEPWGDQLRLALGFTALALLFGAAVAHVAIATSDSRVVRVLRSRALVTLGSYSYAIYLLHVPLLRALSKTGLAPTWAPGLHAPVVWILVFPALMIALSLGAAVVVWHAYEKHFIALKRHFPYRRLAASDGATVARGTPAHSVARLTPRGPGVGAVG